MKGLNPLSENLILPGTIIVIPIDGNAQMKVAVSTWNGRISPVFDVSRTAILLEIEGGRIVARRELPLDEEPVRKIAEIAVEGVETFLCGAVSRQFSDMLAARGILLHPFLAGDVEELIRAYLEGALDHPRYAMPGCCGMRAGSGRGGSCSRRGRPWE
jgi:predicted Fe-Mo cluster-binding NifX family protein